MKTGAPIDFSPFYSRTGVKKSMGRFSMFATPATFQI